MSGIVQRVFDDDPRVRVRLLRIDADNFRRAQGSGTGFRTNPNEIEEALEILGELDEPDPLLRAEVLIDLGDWNVAFDRADEIADPYLEAWELLAAVESGDELRNRMLGDLVIIQSPPFISRLRSRQPDAPRGRLHLQFTVDPQGRANGIVVLESDPPGLLDYTGILQIRYTRFRPQVTDGQLVESTRTIAWNIPYDPRYLLRPDAVVSDSR